MTNANIVMSMMKYVKYSTPLDLEKVYHHIKFSPELQKFVVCNFIGKVCVYVKYPLTESDNQCYFAER